MGMHIILVGNPVDGVFAIGPFNNGEEAFEYANAHRLEEWWAVALEAPEVK